MAKTKQAIHTAANDRLILFPNIINHAKNLCPENSESEAFLAAVNDFRFEGVDSSEIRARLSGYNIVAFDLIAEQAINSMNAYRMKCGQSNSGTVVGGGLAVYADTLRILALATKDSEAGSYFDALYKVQFQHMNADDIEASLPTGAQMVFIMTQRALFGEVEPKKTRSEINRENAMKRWHGNKSGTPDKLPESEMPALPPEVTPCMHNDTAGVQPDQIPKLSSPVAKPEICETDMSMETTTDISNPDLATENKGTVASAESICNKTVDALCENANGCEFNANTDSHPLYKNKSKTKKNNNTPSYTPMISNRAQGSVMDKLQDEFNTLWQIYPKHEDRERSWIEFQRLHPDQTLLDEIYTGLHVAQQQDKRFRGEYRYIPTLRNWLLGKGWLWENMHHLEDPDGRHVNYASDATTPISYSQRPYPSEAAEEERAMRALAILRARYGD